MTKKILETCDILDTDYNSDNLCDLTIKSDTRLSEIDNNFQPNSKL